jgi:hypothetical protein
VRSAGALVGVILVAATIAAGCGGTPKNFSPVVFRGRASGVAMTLTVPPKPRSILDSYPLPTLRLEFASSAVAIWRDVLHAGRLEAFCIWPEPNGGGMNIAEIHISRTLHHNISVDDAAGTSRGPYTCGLHLSSHGTQDGWPWKNYIHHALVEASLMPVHT